MCKLQYLVVLLAAIVVIHYNNEAKANPAAPVSNNNVAINKGELSRLLQLLLPKLRARMGQQRRLSLAASPAGAKAITGTSALATSPEEVAFTDDDFEDLDQLDRFAAKRQADDYGHWRFGKREFDDYGHMRFGR